MDEPHPAFSRMVDDLVESAGSDGELAAGIRMLDAQAQRRGVTFYDVVFEVLYAHGPDPRAGGLLPGAGR